MRRLILRFAFFIGIMEGLRHVDLLVLVAGAALALAAIVCSDLLFA
jgi:hypothetical protein